MLSDPEDEERPDVYTRLSDAKAYKQSGQAVDVWAQKTGENHYHYQFINVYYQFIKVYQLIKVYQFKDAHKFIP